MRGSLIQPVDVYCPAAPGSHWRCYQLFDSGVFRLSRRDSVFYSVMIAAAGSFGRLGVREAATLRPLWRQPSTFTGSFVVDGFAKGGIIVEAYMETPPFITVSWREPDDKTI